MVIVCVLRQKNIIFEHIVMSNPYTLIRKMTELDLCDGRSEPMESIRWILVSLSTKID